MRFVGTFVFAVLGFIAMSNAFAEPAKEIGPKRVCGLFTDTRWGFGLKALDGREYELLIDEDASNEIRNQGKLIGMASHSNGLTGCMDGKTIQGIDSLLFAPSKFDKLTSAKNILRQEARICGILEKKASNSSFEINFDTGLRQMPVMVSAAADDVRKEFEALELGWKHLVCMEAELRNGINAIYPKKVDKDKPVLEVLE